MEAAKKIFSRGDQKYLNTAQEDGTGDEEDCWMELLDAERARAGDIIGMSLLDCGSLFLLPMAGLS